MRESETVTGWFTVSAGKVYSCCPACNSQNISYYKTRRPGLIGVSAASTGLTPACMDCGKSLPTQLQKKEKKMVIQVKLKRAG